MNELVCIAFYVEKSRWDKRANASRARPGGQAVSRSRACGRRRSRTNEIHQSTTPSSDEKRETEKKKSRKLHSVMIGALRSIVRNSFNPPSWCGLKPCDHRIFTGGKRKRMKEIVLDATPSHMSFLPSHTDRAMKLMGWPL